MGLLKHGVLPLFALFHAAMLSLYFSGRLAEFPTLAKFPGHEDERTAIEMHLMGAFMGSIMALLFGCVIGIVQENSHFRGILTVMHLLFFANDAYDNWKLDGFDPTAVTILALIAAVGVAVHSQEPGFFTKDKEKTVKAS